MAAKCETEFEEDQFPSGVVAGGQQDSSLVSRIALNICATTPHGWSPEACSGLHRLY